MHLFALILTFVYPSAYAFESLMVNEFDGREYPCGSFVPAGPSYADASSDNILCNSRGATPGSSVVYGTEYIRISYQYEKAHLWRNFGILIAFMVFFLFTYLLATEKIAAKKSKVRYLTIIHTRHD